jgi:ABC-type transport system involved in cytochrome c biogenesis permease subunit
MNTLPRWLPWIVAGIAVLYLGGQTVPRRDDPDGFHYREFATLPMQDAGRVLPFDTFARVRLMHISNRMTAVHGTYEKDPDNPQRDHLKDEFTIIPTKWALQTMLISFREDNSVLDYRVFRIDNDQVVNFLGLPHRPGSWRYSWNEFAENADFLSQAKRIIEQEGPTKDDIFENKVWELWLHRAAFFKLTRFDVRLIHPAGREQSGDVHWLTLPAAAGEFQQGTEHKALEYYITMFKAYGENKPDEFNQKLEEYQKYLERARPADYHSARLETFFNRFAPFYHAAILYGLVFLLGCVSWLGTSWDHPLRKAAFVLTLLTLAVHTWALIVRISLTGRPPVTNLYSSAIFIGWGCVVLCTILEWLYKSGIGIVVAAITGMITLIVAHNLVTGDTMEMLQAVLDTNFWLATHVVCITFGYTATFVAGFLSILYIVLGIFTPQLRGEGSVNLGKMIYGVTCFAVLLSFVGTVLGGIWADESWGRFWGWDPKENGALLIVIWNALVLHARWSGIVKARGMANLAIFGNCVVAWSWFGTNLLGVGLHSYGFMKGAMIWLLVFVFSQLLIIGLGCLPLRMWQSFKPAKPPGSPPAPKSSAMASATVST